jgi:hypothetical protein
MMSEDKKVYGDEEVTLILHKASELARASSDRADSSLGLSLEDIKGVGAEVGLDPSLIERAARLVPPGAKDSRLESILGGPLQYRRDVRVSTTLTAKSSAHLLSTVRATVEEQGDGHSDASGMSWHSKTGVVQTSVTANPESDATQIRLRIDRRRLAILTACSSLVASVPFASPLIDAGPSILTVALAVLPVTLGRMFWSYHTRRTREKAEAVVDAAGRSLAEPDHQPE